MHVNTSKSSQQGHCLKFNLVCDPKYQQHRRGARFPPILINPPQKCLTGKHSTYDLGWTVPAEDLPPQSEVCFSVSGAAVNRLVLDETAEETADRAKDEEDRAPTKPSIPLTVSCFKVRQGRPVRDTRNRKWRLQLCTDPATGCLYIRHMQRIAFYCNNCKKEITAFVRACKVCRFFSLCLSCSLMRAEEHKHPFTRIIDLRT